MNNTREKRRALGLSSVHRDRRVLEGTGAKVRSKRHSRVFCLRHSSSRAAVPKNNSRSLPKMTETAWKGGKGREVPPLPSRAISAIYRSFGLTGARHLAATGRLHRLRPI